MVTFIIETIIVASLTAWLLTLLDKWGVIEWCQVNAKSDLIWEMLNCDYCKCWWVSVAVSLILAVATANGWALLIPFISTKIAQKLL